MGPLVRYIPRRRIPSALNARQKVNARQLSKDAQRRGLLTPKPCEVCGSLDVEKHHDDYTKPLEVRWLCRTHHAEVTQGARQMAPPDVSDVTDLDRSTWFTKQEVAARLQVTTKTVERFAQEGKIQQARWRRPTGGPTLVVYHPLDVANLVQERKPGALPAFLVPGPGHPANGNGAHADAGLAAPVPTTEDLWRVLLTSAARVVSETSQTSPSESSQKSPTLYVTVKEAAAILGLPQADVRRLIHDGDLNHRVTGRGGIRIRRRDLEAL